MESRANRRIGHSLASRSSDIAIEALIRERLRVVSPADIPELQLYCAHPGSRLGAMPGAARAGAPYWAFPWAGGLALSRYILDHREAVAGKSLLDLGAGGGVVGIAAAVAGARRVFASDIDPRAASALPLNAALNGVAVEITIGDILGGEPPDAEIIAAGDLFYDARLARRAFRFLMRCAAQGCLVLIGDPGRRFLPQDRLQMLKRCPVQDFAGNADNAAVFTLRP